MTPELFNEEIVIWKKKKKKEGKHLRPKQNIILLEFLLYMHKFTLMITWIAGQGN